MEYPHCIFVHQPGGIECVHLAGPGTVTHVSLPDALLDSIRQERAFYQGIAADPGKEKEAHQYGS